MNMKKGITAYPYIGWMLIFIMVPIILVLYYSITISTPSGTIFSFENYKKFIQPIYLKVLARSINLALLSTLICLIIGYPVAMILAGKDLKNKSLLLLLFIIPMWMNFLVRTYAWMTLLENKGLLNTFLNTIGLPPLRILYTDSAVVLGMVYNFLPFMVLPIFSVLSKIDRNVIEAAEDLGANSLNVFRKITLPLSFPGVMSGITMVFMPAVTTFVISKLLGGNQYTLIGNLIEDQFMRVYDWNFGSSVSIIMMVLILLSMTLLSRNDKEDMGGRLI